MVGIISTFVGGPGCLSSRDARLHGKRILLGRADSAFVQKELRQEASRLRGTQPIEARELCSLPNVGVQLVRIVGAEKPHRHPDHDLVVFLLEGRGLMLLGQETHAIEAGDVVVIERGAEHAFRNANHGGTVAIVVRVPPAPPPGGTVH
ncbi:MAG: hypothetical protein KatS3mg077_0435 [Candidatus Binatia bacterium]|nr:MAG: hypothetical protein KatS3mg077_0435 [Candidatus Binatia bacterium]